MSVSTRTRFEIFKRDGFRCVYCGAAPTSTVLHVDHVVPKSKGGSDDPSNLVTSCQSCNGGKSNVRLEDKRYSTMDTDMAKDHANQILGYLEAQRALMSARDSILDELCEKWAGIIGWDTDASERSSIAGFVELFSFEDLVRAMEIAGRKFNAPVGYAPQSTKAFRYFCGIVHTWRRDGVVSMARRPSR